MPQIKLKPVTWKEGKYAGALAYIGRVQIGRVNWTMKRDDPTPWYASLVFDTASLGFATLEEAKANVEARALEWVEKVAEATP